MTARSRPGAAYRFSVAGRVILAAVGGYIIAALSAAVLAVVLPLSPAESVSTGILASFAVLAASAIWVFAARTLARAALALGLLAVVLGAVLWLSGALTTGSVGA